MYFNTLKVSSVDQTTSQIEARGGRGNPAQIGWDYGKDITVTLEDALYTPASQSLMWGAKFGTKRTKIRGLWNPYIQDERSTQYQFEIYYPYYFIENEYGDFEPQVEVRENLQYVFCKKVVFEPTSGENIYVPIDTDVYVLLDELKTFHRAYDEEEKPYYYKTISEPIGHYKYEYANYGADYSIPYPQTNLMDIENYYHYYQKEGMFCYTSEAALDEQKWKNNKRPEIAEVTLDNYGDFSLERQDGIRNYIGDSQEITNGSTDLSRFLQYKWEDVGITMASLEGDRDVYYMDHCTMSFQVRNNFSNKFVSFSTPYYKPTIFDSESGEWIEDRELKDFIEYPRERILEEGKSWKRRQDNFYPHINFYSISKQQVPNGTWVYFYKLVGTFFIIIDWNVGSESAQESIYPIEKGFSQERYIERTQFCTAPRRFAINTDSNMQCSNYRYLQKYRYSELTVYIDPKTMKPFSPNSSFFINAAGQKLGGQFKIFKPGEVYYKWERVKAPPNISIGNTLIIDAEHYPGTYRLVGETFAKDRNGNEKHFQFEIPLAKMSTENKLNLRADGEPVTFTFKLKALRREDGVMMKITDYSTDCNFYGEYASDSDKVVPIESTEFPEIVQKYDYTAKAKMELLYPREEDMYEVSIDNPEEEITPIVGLTTIKNTSISTYDKNTLQKISEENLTKENTEILTPGVDYTITIKNNRTEASE